MNGSKIIYGIGISILVLMLIAVRFYQTHIFYDPLDDYFHGNFHHQSFPKMRIGYLFLSNSARFVLNTALSIGILWLLFKSQSYLKAITYVYVFAFFLLIIVFFVALQFDQAITKMVVFYSRRFIIHPLLLFVLIAGGYFLKSDRNT